MSEERSTAIIVAIIGGIFGVITAVIHVLPMFLNAPSPSDAAAQVRPVPDEKRPHAQEREWRLRVSSDRPVYREGERLRVKVESERDCFCHVYLCGKEGVATRIFPNQDRPQGRLEANRPLWVPEEASVFDLEISGEEEEEEIIAYASDRPLPELEGKWGVYGMKSMARATMEHGYASGEIKKASGTIVVRRK